MNDIWEACPTLKQALFKAQRSGYYDLVPASDSIRETVSEDASFKAQYQAFNDAIGAWRNETTPELKDLSVGCKPKEIIVGISERLRVAVKDSPSLVNGYDAYDQMMNYWAETMQDDCYMISDQGWKVDLRLPLDKKGVVKKSFDYTALVCDLLPVNIVINEYFLAEQEKVNETTAKVEDLQQQIDTLLEENAEDFDALERANAANVKKVAKTCADSELKALYKQYLDLDDALGKAKKEKSDAIADLTKKIVAKYDALTEDEIKHLVVDCKWMASITNRLQDEMIALTQQITDRVSTLADRYANTLGETTASVSDLEKSVLDSLKEMGFTL